jgi:hypothetical protein
VEAQKVKAWWPFPFFQGVSDAGLGLFQPQPDSSQPGFGPLFGRFQRIPVFAQHDEVVGVPDDGDPGSPLLASDCPFQSVQGNVGQKGR